MKLGCDLNLRSGQNLLYQDLLLKVQNSQKSYKCIGNKGRTKWHHVFCQPTITLHVKVVSPFMLRFKPIKPMYLEWYSPSLDLEHTIQVFRGEIVKTSIGQNYCYIFVLISVLSQHFLPTKI